jgi:hypothetical protein
MAKRILQVVAALAVVAAVGAFVYVQLDDPDACDVCYRPMHQETFYRIHLEGGDTKDVCCPRCGLRFQEGRNDVVATEVAGMHEDRSGVQYEVAWDRCLPSLIAFSSREAAQKFQHDNGGDIKTYQELLAEHS